MGFFCAEVLNKYLAALKIKTKHPYKMSAENEKCMKN
jgi:hypothetical protein